MRLNPATNRLVATLAMPELVGAGVAVGADALWMLSADMAVRIDPRRIPS